jgi:hypothetical protein
MTSPFLGTSVNVCASIRVPVCYRDGDCGLGRLCGVKGSYGPGGMSERRSIAGLSDRSKTNRNGAIEIDDPLGKLVIRRTPGPQPATLIVGQGRHGASGEDTEYGCRLALRLAGTTQFILRARPLMLAQSVAAQGTCRFHKIIEHRFCTGEDFDGSDHAWNDG